MPTGKVKFFDVEKGFGFVTGDDGEQAFLHASALPDGVTELKPGTRLEYDIVAGRKGTQVLKARLLEPVKPARRKRRSATELSSMVQDVINLLDQESNSLRQGRYPDRAHGKKIAALLRAIADDLEG